MVKTAWWTIAATVALTGVARADPQDDGKSESVALTLSAAGTVVGPALGFWALEYGGRRSDLLRREFWPLLSGSIVAVVAPSLGEWYAGKGISRGLKVRLAGAVAAGVGALVTDAALHDHNGLEDGSFALGLTLACLGLATAAVGDALDVYDAPGAVRDYNRAHVRVSVAPTALGNGGHGLALVGAF